MAAALRIPISANMADFEAGMEKAKGLTRTGVQFMAKEFIALNKEITAGGVAATAMGTGMLSTATRVAAGFVATRVAIAAAMLAIGGAIVEARRQLEEMVEIADKAGARGVSAEFFQGFLLAARNLKIEAKDLESALTRAFEATKEKIDQTLPLLDRLKEFFLAGLVGPNAQGLDLFRGAQNQDQKVRAILVAMIELERVGQRLAAFDIGEKMFGSAFVDKIRQGKTSAQEMLDTLDKAKSGGVAGGEIFSEELVKRADDVDKKLRQAHETLERNLRPAWDGLADAALAIKSIWADIVGLIAAAATVSAVFGRQTEQQQNIQERDQLRLRLADENLQYAAREQILRRIRLLEAKGLSQYDAQTIGTEFSTEPTSGSYGPPPIPMPRENPLKGTFGHERRFDEKPKAEGKDEFETEIKRLERHIAVQEADAEAVGKTDAAKERLRAESVLLNAAERAGIDLLDINNPKMEEYIERIDKAAAAAEAAKKRHDDLNRSFREFQDASREFGSALSDAFKSAILQGKSLGDVLKSLTDRLASKSIDKLFDLFFAAPSGGGGSPVGNLFSKLFGGHLAAGGDVDPGKFYVVGEHGPELLAPRTPGSVIPNDVVSRAASSGPSHVDNRRSYNIDARGAQAGVAQQIVTALKAYDRQLPGRITEMQITGV